jgi:sRNA-binding carbon storage regulator CsrA
MLVLGMREGDRIFLSLPDGGQVEVRLLARARQGHGQTRIGIAAPRSVVIQREAVQRKIAEEQAS